jgi:hypothetical protein
MEGLHMSDEHAEDEQASDDANEAPEDSTDHPESSDYGPLDAEKLLEHADQVDDAIQEAKRRNS